jgi:hypothetical protein
VEWRLLPKRTATGRAQYYTSARQPDAASSSR